MRCDSCLAEGVCGDDALRAVAAQERKRPTEGRAVWLQRKLGRLATLRGGQATTESFCGVYGSIPLGT